MGQNGLSEQDMIDLLHVPRPFGCGGLPLEDLDGIVSVSYPQREITVCTARED